MEYKYNDNTLIHSVGFNFAKLESIFKYGILSFDKAKELGISYGRNYYGYNLNDTVSCVRYSYINTEIEDSAYQKYIKNGIGLIIEDISFIYNKNERIIRKSDEVLVQDYIPSKNIKGLIVPGEYIDVFINDLVYLPVNATSYINIKHSCDMILNYLKSYNYEPNKEEINNFLIELHLINNAVKHIKENKADYMHDQDYIELSEDFKDVICGLNEFIGEEFLRCFSRILGKSDITVMDMVNYINNKYEKFNIYDLSSIDYGKGPKR